MSSDLRSVVVPAATVSCFQDQSPITNNNHVLLRYGLCVAVDDKKIIFVVRRTKQLLLCIIIVVAQSLLLRNNCYR